MDDHVVHPYYSACEVAMITIRPAGQGDLARILEIYNREVLLSTATYDTQPRTMGEQKKWFAVHGTTHPVIVACGDDSVVRGWGSLSPWSDRAAYGRSVEVSVYVAEESRRAGVGRQLLSKLIEVGRERGFHALLSRISADNEASVRLHAQAGFFLAGTLKEVGVKFGRSLDVAIMELLL